MEKKFIVCTDSGCDLKVEDCEQYEIFAMPLKYELNGVEHTDTMRNEDCHIFYEGMRAGDAPKTSQANTVQFTEFWTPLLEKYDLPIVHIALGSAISGTYNSGVMAAEAIKESFPDAEIYMVDSTLASIGYGILAQYAADMRDNGATPQECVAWLEENKPRMHAYYTTDDLKYLYRSGRVSKTSAMLANALNICPILNLDLAGHLLVQDKVRGTKKAIKKIHEYVAENVINAEEQVTYVCHSDIEERAHKFGEDLKAEFGFKEIKYTYIGPTIGANCGPQLMAIFFLGKPRTMKGYNGE